MVEVKPGDIICCSVKELRGLGSNVGILEVKITLANLTGKKHFEIKDGSILLILWKHLGFQDAPFFTVFWGIVLNFL